MTYGYRVKVIHEDELVYEQTFLIEDFGAGTMKRAEDAALRLKGIWHDADIKVEELNRKFGRIPEGDSNA